MFIIFSKIILRSKKITQINIIFSLKAFILLFALVSTLFYNTHALLPAGSLDTTFGENGLVTNAFSDRLPSNTKDSALSGLAILPNNTILAIGNTHTPFVLPLALTVNYFSNGHINSLFYQNRFFEGWREANAVTLSAYEGTTIVIAGANTNPNRPHESPMVIGFDLNGNNQRGFINYIFRDFPQSNGGNMLSVAVDTLSNIIMAGYVIRGQKHHFGLIKITRHGDIDSTFGINGFVETNFTNISTDFSQINSIAIYPNPINKIIVAGQAKINNQWRFVLARYLRTGDLDTSFGELVNPSHPQGPRTGKIIANFAPITLVSHRNDKAYAITLQTINSEIKIIAAGSTSRNNKKPLFALTRYNDDGTLDPTFGYPGTGIRINCFGTIANEAKAVVIDSQNRIVVTGKATTGTPRTPLDQFIVARYTPNGNTDASFGFKGAVFTPFFKQGAGATSIVIQPDGKIIAGGYAQQNSNTLFALARYNS